MQGLVGSVGDSYDNTLAEPITGFTNGGAHKNTALKVASIAHYSGKSRLKPEPFNDLQ